MLTDTLKELALLRRQQLDQAQTVAEAEALLHDTPEWQAYEQATNQRRAITEALDATTTAVRQAALDAYKASGDKAPAKGVSIKLFKRYVYDQDQTREWCMAYAPTFLTVDAKRFEKAAETLDGAPVRVEYDPRPAIAGDLSEYEV
jgi:hypothetical protein